MHVGLDEHHLNTINRHGAVDSLDPRPHADTQCTRGNQKKRLKPLIEDEGEEMVAEAKPDPKVHTAAKSKAAPPRPLDQPAAPHEQAEPRPLDQPGEQEDKDEAEGHFPPGHWQSKGKWGARGQKGTGKKDRNKGAGKAKASGAKPSPRKKAGEQEPKQKPKAKAKKQKNPVEKAEEESKAQRCTRTVAST